MKTLLLIMLLSLFISGYSQTTKEKITAKKAEFKTIVEQIEKLKMEQDFTVINPDTLDAKKNVIVFGKDNGRPVLFLKVGSNNYKIDNLSINMVFNGENYTLKNEGDSLKCYGDKGVLLFTIQ